jgi:hypothetical protein
MLEIYRTMTAKMVVLSVTLFVFCLLVEKISGHGMMLEPPNRSSLWRFDPTAPPNYDDNQNFCGGVAVSTYSFLKSSSNLQLDFV